jgi:hypothetical protein
MDDVFKLKIMGWQDKDTKNPNNVNFVPTKPSKKVVLSKKGWRKRIESASAKQQQQNADDENSHADEQDSNGRSGLEIVATKAATTDSLSSDSALKELGTFGKRRKRPQTTGNKVRYSSAGFSSGYRMLKKHVESSDTRLRAVTAGASTQNFISHKSALDVALWAREHANCDNVAEDPMMELVPELFDATLQTTDLLPSDSKASLDSDAMSISSRSSRVSTGSTMSRVSKLSASRRRMPMGIGGSPRNDMGSKSTTRLLVGDANEVDASKNSTPNVTEIDNKRRQMFLEKLENIDSMSLSNSPRGFGFTEEGQGPFTPQAPMSGTAGVLRRNMKQISCQTTKNGKMLSCAAGDAEYLNSLVHSCKNFWLCEEKKEKSLGFSLDVMEFERSSVLEKKMDVSN